MSRNVHHLMLLLSSLILISYASEQKARIQIGITFQKPPIEWLYERSSRNKSLNKSTKQPSPDEIKDLVALATGIQSRSLELASVSNVGDDHIKVVLNMYTPGPKEYYVGQLEEILGNGNLNNKHLPLKELYIYNVAGSNNLAMVQIDIQ